jgi:hypothetical protein
MRRPRHKRRRRRKREENKSRLKQDDDILNPITSAIFILFMITAGGRI